MQISKVVPCVRCGTVFLLAVVMVLYLNVGSVYAVDFEKYPQASELVTALTDQTGLKKERVESIVREAVFKDDIIKAITRPAEKKFPWYRYRPIFIHDKGIDLGVEYWNRHEEVLQQAYETYGVNPAIIVAILGVETRYGKITGRHRVIDSLVTIALGYPRRSEFFARQLGEFLELCEEENLNPLLIKGSYAGAMGIPQFISSSYRDFAVDFNDNGQRNLLSETEDAIGSVANYLAEHNWVKDGQVYAEIQGDNVAVLEPIVSKKLKTSGTYGDLKAMDVELEPSEGLSLDQKLGVIRYEVEPDKFIFRAGLPNFYAITTYNRSTLYAMAVAELAEQLAQARSAIN
ncbi:MAG: lytic murein transglycosylase B [Acidiferrobacterales bacterium]|nr:lytic murein transglycosylase B [Acidiferrobacterales bacterium]